MPQHALVGRHVRPLVEELARDLRVVIVNGPRQAGKTTLLRELQAASGGTYYTLDQPEIFQFAQDDPVGLVTGARRPVYIDEVQRAGDPLVRAIKIAVDADTQPGSFILSGSSRFLTIPTLSESLVGRAAVVELWPLSVAERVGAPPHFIDQLFDDHSAIRDMPPSAMTRLEYLQLTCAGGFPELLRARSSRGRANWFKGYLTTLVQRDIREITQVRFASEIPRVLGMLAAHTAQTVNVTALARDLGLDAATLGRYLSLMEQVYLIHWLPTWSSNLTARATRRPRLHFVDTGIAARLINRSAQSLAQPGVTEAGALFESFIVGEIMKQAGLASTEVALLHYRDRNDTEIDCVLEAPDRRIAGIEIKLAMSTKAADFRHLRAVRDQVGDRFVCGILLYCGEHVVPFGDRLLAVPASALWSGMPVPTTLPS